MFQTDETFLLFKNFMNNYKVPVLCLDKGNLDFASYDNGLRERLFSNVPYKKVLTAVFEIIKPNCLYHIFDEMLCTYNCFLHPAYEHTIIIIGPYRTKEYSENELLHRCVERLALPPDSLEILSDFHRTLPYFSDESIILKMLNSYGQILWGDIQAFSFKHLENDLVDSITNIFRTTPELTPKSILDKMNDIEERYQLENEMMEAVTHGQLNRTGIFVQKLEMIGITPYTSDWASNAKAYLFMMNTLFRKAAETGGVHPYYLDELSAFFSRKIHQLTTKEDWNVLCYEIIRKYCLLVKNRSMNQYSPLVQKTIVRIDADPSAPISLTEQADILNVNPKYLSTLFKQNTGISFSEYVAKKRIERAIFLLNTTNLQIQTIAEYSGIPDLNYFSKLFKKVTGMRPTEYRKNIKS